MAKGLKEKLKGIISEFGVVRCVYIEKNDHFFIFRKIPRYDGGDVNYEDGGYGQPIAVVYGDGQGDFDDCVILYDNRLIQKKKKIKTYLFQYSQNIEQSPEFTISDILEKKTFKVFSKKYLTPIKNLFRDIFLLKDGRAGRCSADPMVIKRNQFFISSYAKYGSPNRIPMKRIQEAWEKKISKEFPNDTDRG